MPSFKSTFAALALVGATAVNAAATSYCSNDNTGASSKKITSIYNSQGSCTDSCQGYQYAVLQYQNCWCSNDKPSDTTDISKCHQQCPGYPMDTCGNENEGLFTYVAIEGAGYGGTPTPASGASATAMATDGAMSSMSAPAYNGTMPTMTSMANSSSGAASSSGTSSGSPAAFTGAASNLGVAVWNVVGAGALLGCAVGYVL